MPGVEDGSSRIDAHTWDFTQHRLGIRVGGAVANSNGDWWAAYLTYGVLYRVSTLTPTAFDTVLELYDPDGLRIVIDDDSGDGDLSSFLWRCLRTGWHNFRVRGATPSDLGAYLLECTPPPVNSLRTSGASASFNNRSQNEAAAAGDHSAILDPYIAGASCRFNRNGLKMAGTPAAFDTRALTTQGSGGSINIIQIIYCSGAGAQFNAIGAKIAAALGRFSVRGTQNSSAASARFEVRTLSETVSGASFNTRALQTVGTPARHNAQITAGYALYATNLSTGIRSFLGFIAADAEDLTLSDVAIPNGNYTIEVIAAESFWDDVRCRDVVTLIASDDPPVVGLPPVVALRSIRYPTRTLIKWNTPEELAPAATHFGLWFGATSPVNTSGDPDAIVVFAPGQGEYQYSYTQTSQVYVAIRAISTDDLGPVTELLLPFDSVPLASPMEQLVR